MRLQDLDSSLEDIFLYKLVFNLMFLQKTLASKYCFHDWRWDLDLDFCRQILLNYSEWYLQIDVKFLIHISSLTRLMCATQPGIYLCLLHLMQLDSSKCDIILIISGNRSRKENRCVQQELCSIRLWWRKLTIFQLRSNSNYIPKLF